MDQDTRLRSSKNMPEKAKLERKEGSETQTPSALTHRVENTYTHARNGTMWKRLARRAGTNTSKSTTHTHTRKQASRHAHSAQMRSVQFQIKSQETCTIRQLRLWELALENRNAMIFLAGCDSRPEYKTLDERKSHARENDLSCELREK